MKRRTVARLVESLVELPPGSKAAEELRLAIEQGLMAAAQAGGRAATDELLDTVGVAGRSLALVREVGTMRTWRAMLDGHRLLALAVDVGGDILCTYVDYRVVKPIQLTKQQQRAAELQAAFYARYESIGRIAYAPGAKSRLTREERLILLVGELEADVNNGGFGQYLSNKGRQRARAALRALLDVGAKKTARWLDSALERGASVDALQRLDQRFNAHSEDLACLVMRHLSRPAR